MTWAPLQCRIGDIVKMKKPHPCGSDQWEITRTGMDIGIRCLKCGRQVLLPRPKFEKAVKKLTSPGAAAPAPAPLPPGKGGKK